MTRISVSIIIVILAVALGLLIHSAYVASQTGASQPELSTVLEDVRKAELSGGNTAEMQKLVNQLNTVVGLEDQVHGLSPQDPQRASLLAQINATLTNVDGEAKQLQVTAAQRTYMDHVYAYTGGVVAAVIATVAYFYAMLLYQKYRIKRTFQMRIIPSKREV